MGGESIDKNLRFRLLAPGICPGVRFRSLLRRKREVDERLEDLRLTFVESDTEFIVVQMGVPQFDFPRRLLIEGAGARQFTFPFRDLGGQRIAGKQKERDFGFLGQVLNDTRVKLRLIDACLIPGRRVPAEPAR